ncbi:MAG: hypothetical protein R3F02_03215 [Thiolinea sp.]
MNRRQLQPYPGLRPFERYESKVFFGRQKQVDELLKRLKKEKFLAVLGASGSGKSSLVKAGLLPGLEKGYMGELGAKWRIVELRPGDQPFERLAEGLNKIPSVSPFTKGSTPRSDTETSEEWSPPLKKGEQGGFPADQTTFLTAQLRRGARSLHTILEQSPLDDGEKLLILVDQFEEIFRYRQQAGNQAAAFVALLLEACTHPDIFVVITMRSDFLGDAAAFHGLPEAINDGLYLTPRLTREQLREAIALPAKLFGGEVEDALVNRFLNEAGNDPDQLPLLQHALMRLWTADEDKQLTLAEYQDLGGLRGALDGHLERVFTALKPEQQAIAEVMFRLLTTQGEDGQAIRRPAQVQEVLAVAHCGPDELEPVVEAFRGAGRHFLMTSTPELSEQTVLDISHESLIRQWQQLHQWATSEHQKSGLYLRLIDAEKRYQHQEGELLRGVDLAVAERWQQAQKPDAVWAKRYADETKYPAVLEFLKQSARQQTEDEQHIAALYQRQTEILFDAYLRNAALECKAGDYLAARKALVDTYELDEKNSPNRTHARDLLAGFVEIMGGQAERTLTDEGGKPLPQLTGNVAVSPDGQWLAASGERGTIALFERASGRLVQKLVGHNAIGRSSETSVYDIVFHPEQPWLFSAGADGQIIWWQLPQDGNEAVVLEQWAVDAAPWALALTPDGQTLASGHTDGGIRLWAVEGLKHPHPNPSNGEGLKPGSTEKPPRPQGEGVGGEGEGRQPLKTLTGHQHLIATRGLTFDPQGRWLASASYDDTVRIWDLQNGETLHVLQAHNSDVHGVAFSPNGKWLASSSADQSIILWNVESGRGIRRLKGHQNMIFGLKFINDQLLTSASSDNTVRLWDVETGVTRRVLQGHTAGVGGLALYENNGQSWLYSNSNDGTVKQWRADLPGQWLVDLPGEPASAAISPTGKLLALGYANGSLELYDLATLELLDQTENVHSSDINRLDFTNDGQFLASAGGTSAKLWEVSSQKLIAKNSFDEHAQMVYAVTFSPDNTQLATASYDGKIGLFDLESGEGELFEAHEVRNASSFDGVASVSFAQNGQLLSAGISDFLIKLWQPKNNSLELITEYPKLADIPLWASLSPNGSHLASVGREATVTVYPTQGQQHPLRLNGHEQTVYKAIFSPDSRQLATVSWDMTVRLWDLDTENELFRLRLPDNFRTSGSLWDFDFRCTPTGCWIAVPLTSGKLALYNLGKIDY